MPRQTHPQPAGTPDAFRAMYESADRRCNEYEEATTHAQALTWALERALMDREEGHALALTRLLSERLERVAAA